MSRFCLGCVKVPDLLILLHSFGKSCISYPFPGGRGGGGELYPVAAVLSCASSTRCLACLAELRLLSCFLLNKMMHHSTKINWLVWVKAFPSKSHSSCSSCNSFFTLSFYFPRNWYSSVVSCCFFSESSKKNAVIGGKFSKQPEVVAVTYSLYNYSSLLTFYTGKIQRPKALCRLPGWLHIANSQAPYYSTIKTKTSLWISLELGHRQKVHDNLTCRTTKAISSVSYRAKILRVEIMCKVWAEWQMTSLSDTLLWWY